MPCSLIRIARSFWRACISSILLEKQINSRAARRPLPMRSRISKKQ